MANLDLSLATIQVTQSEQVKPADEWIIPSKNHKAVKKVIPEKATPEEIKNTWVPVADTAHAPKWIGNLIDSDEFTDVARQAGGDGKVVLQVHIDTSGEVREVALLNGSNEILNEFAIRKVKNGIFTPAYDKQGSPVACEVILPILFKLVG
jgi:TonB family protein